MRRKKICENGKILSEKRPFDFHFIVNIKRNFWWKNHCNQGTRTHIETLFFQRDNQLNLLFVSVCELNKFSNLIRFSRGLNFIGRKLNHLNQGDGVKAIIEIPRKNFLFLHSFNNLPTQKKLI